MNILFICDEYPPGKNGGVGTMVQVLSRELVKQGHRVFVAGLYAYSYGEKNYEEDKGVKVWRFRYGVNLFLDGDNIMQKIFNKIPWFIKRHLNGIQAFNKFLDFINLLIDKEQIEVIEIPDWNTFAMRIGFLVKWPAFKIPLIVKSHGSYTYFANEMKTPAKKKISAIDRELFKRADALSAVSLYTANKNKMLFDLEKETTVLYNAIEEPGLTPVLKEEQKIVFSGTLMKKKGIFQLMKAWNIVVEKKPKGRLFVFGKGDINSLKTLLNKNALETVIFKGHIERKELFNELASATLAVFPSFSETFGLVAIEAMSLGCPVIFTKKASGPEIITDKWNGELIDPNVVEEIADSILRIMDNKDLQARYSFEGKKTVHDKFNITTSARNHIAYYSHVSSTFKTKNNLQK